MLEKKFDREAAGDAQLPLLLTMVAHSARHLESHPIMCSSTFHQESIVTLQQSLRQACDRIFDREKLCTCLPAIWLILVWPDDGL